MRKYRGNAGRTALRIRGHQNRIFGQRYAGGTASMRAAYAAHDRAISAARKARNTTNPATRYRYTRLAERHFRRYKRAQAGIVRYLNAPGGSTYVNV